MIGSSRPACNRQGPHTATDPAPAGQALDLDQPGTDPASSGAPRGRAHWRGQADRQRCGTDRQALDLDRLGARQRRPGEQRQHLEVWRTGVARPG